VVIFEYLTFSSVQARGMGSRSSSVAQYVKSVQAGAELIRYPDLPEGSHEAGCETDPVVRIERMITIFNERTKATGKYDKGLYHEIQTAKELWRPESMNRVGGAFTRYGHQISRALTKEEKARGLAGDSQMILVPSQNRRELDAVCRENDGTWAIVEAKSTKVSDSSQMELNARLAQQLGWGVIYAIPGEKGGKSDALEAAYERLRPKLAEKGPFIPPFRVIHIARRIGHFVSEYSNHPQNMEERWTPRLEDWAYRDFNDGKWEEDSPWEVVGNGAG
jgi:hypothetical protein